MLLLLFPFFTFAQFECGDTFTDVRNGMKYPTVQIGDQCWFAKNLDIGVMLDVTSVNLNQTNNGIFEKYCYNSDSQNCALYGGLYQWEEALNYTLVEKAQGLCPAGWHIPSLAEFDTLVAVYGSALAGKELQKEGISGFEALPSGYCYFNYQKWVFGSLGQYGVIRTSTEGSTAEWAWVFYYYPGVDDISKTGSYRKINGYSIRCLSDFPAHLPEIKSGSTQPQYHFTNDAVQKNASLLFDTETEALQSEVAVYTLNGSKISDLRIRKNGKSIRIDYSSLPPGLFILRVVIAGKGIFAHKLLSY